MTIYKIDITSDILCPWCYIGHARLTRAMTAHQRLHPTDKFHLRYHPFYLAPPPPSTLSTPAFPTPSRPRIDHYTAKFGPQRTPQIFAMVGRAAAGEGLNFKFGGMTGHSRNGHRLVYYAQQRPRQAASAGTSTSAVNDETTSVDGDAQNRTMLALWRAYFESETDITLLSTLTSIGVSCGLGSEESIREYLVSGADGDVVDALAEEARRGGEVQGVPFYVVQGRYGVSGAQEPGVFEGVFERVKREDEERGRREEVGGVGEGGGDACGVDGVGC